MDKMAHDRRANLAQDDALATVRRFSVRISAGAAVWFWPKIAAALACRHRWVVIACDSCGAVMDLDLRLKRATRRHQFVWRFAMSDARAAIVTRGHAYGLNAQPIDIIPYSFYEIRERGLFLPPRRKGADALFESPPLPRMGVISTLCDQLLFTTAS